MLSIWKAAIITTEGAVGFLANLTVILVMMKHPKLMGAQSSRFILNQSFIDALVSIMIIVSHNNLVRNIGLQVSYSDGNIFDEIICRTWRFELTVWGFMASSAFNLVMLTIDRYIKIVHPFWHKRHVTKGKTLVVLVLPWILGPAFQLACFAPVADVRNNTCLILLWPNQWSSQIVSYLVPAIEYFIPVITMVYCYGRILYTIQHRWKGLNGADTTSTGNISQASTVTEDISTSHITLEMKRELSPSQSQLTINELPSKSHDHPPPKQSTQNTNHHQQNQQAQKKVIKLLITVCVGFFLCFLFNQAITFLANIGVINLIYGNPLYSVSVMLAFANCLINPFIYVIQYEKFRALLMETIKCW